MARPLLLASLLLTACARPAPEPPPRPLTATEARRASCPPPLAWSPGEPRPRGVRIENATEEAILVFLDGCWRHDRIGTVQPGATRLFRLPDRLVPLPEPVPAAAGSGVARPTADGAMPGPAPEPVPGLRFHAYAVATLDYHSRHTLPLDTTTILALRVEPRATPRCDPLVFVDGERFDGTLADLPMEAMRDVSVRDFQDPSRCREYHVTTK